MDDIIIVKDNLWDEVNVAERVARSVMDEEGPSAIDEKPTYICNLGEIVRKIVDWKSRYADIGCYYAVKCNPDPVLLAFMANMGVNFDCASKSEIKQILDIGVDASRIVYSNPVKSISNLQYSHEKVVNLLVFDTTYELDKIHKIYHDCADLKLLVRIHVNDASAAFAAHGDKAGVRQDEYECLLKKARDLGLNIVGVAFHCGSGCTDERLYEQAIQYTYEVFQSAKEYGFFLNVIDVGGGFTDSLEHGTTMDEMMECIQKATRKVFCDEERRKKLQIFAEPGQYLAKSTFSLLTTVIGKRKLLINGHTEFAYTLNDGIHGSFCLSLFHLKNWFIPPVVINRKDDKPKPTYPSTIWGPTCHGRDKIAKFQKFVEVSIGDILLWRDIGAYSSALMTRFNGFGEARSVYLMSNRWNNMWPNTKLENVIIR